MSNTKRNHALRPFWLGIAITLLGASGAAWAATFPYFSPANGILKGNASTYITTAATASDVISLWSGTCNATTFMRADGSCQVISATPGGSTTQVQFNNAGAFAGDTAFLYDSALDLLTVPTLNAPTTLTFSTGGTSRLTIASGGIVAGSATGAAQGAGTINAQGLYVNGVAVSAGGTPPGGATTNVQYNNAGAFAGDADFAYNAALNLITLGVPATPGFLVGGSNAAGTGGQITVRGGGTTGAGNAGGLASVRGGIPTDGVGGAVELIAANGAGTNRGGGAVTITSGTGIGTAGGGSINVQAGTGGAGGASGGAIAIQGGPAVGGAAGGSISLIAGLSPSSVAGNVNLTGGTTTSGTAGSVRATTGGVERFEIRGDGGFEIAGSQGTAGQVLTSGGAGVVPSWSSVPALGGTNTWTGANTFTLPITADAFRTDSSASEGVRIVNDAGYISFYNTTDTTRTGFLQMISGGATSILLSNEFSGGHTNLTTVGVGQVRVNGSQVCTANGTGCPVAEATTTGGGTVVGCTTDPGVSARWVRQGNTVTLRFMIGGPGTCTSNSSGFSFTSFIPATYAPASAQACTFLAVDNATNIVGAIEIGTGTTATLRTALPSNAWTNSGAKGMPYQAACSYTLN